MDATLASLHDFVARELLDGQAAGLDARTPLLELGVIDSLSMVSLLSFIERDLGVAVPMEQILPEHFQDLGAIARLVDGLRCRKVA